MFFDWILGISLTAISSILRSTGSMLPSTSIASPVGSVAEKPKGGGFTLSTRLIVLVSCCNVDL